MLFHRLKATSQLVFSLLVTIPLLTGCWDRLEVEQRGTVLGIAIDSQADDSASSKESDGDTSATDATGSSEVQSAGPSSMKLTAQIAVPGRIPLGPGETGGGGGTSPKSAVWVVHSYGKTLDDALLELQQQVADKLFLGHLRVIVVSERFAREVGLEAITDTLRRNPEIRRTAWLIVSKGPANSVMKTSPPLERVPTLYLMSTMDHAKQLGKLPNDFLGVFESRSVMKGRDPVLPFVKVTQKDNIDVSGLAFFKGYKMVDTTGQAIDISPYMQLVGVTTGGYGLMVPVPGESDSIMWQAYRRKRKIKVEIQNGRPKFTVDIHVDGNIIGKSSDQFTIDNPQMIRKIDAEISRLGVESSEKLIELTKRDDTDVVGFGEYVRARQSRYWDKYVKTRDKWREIYPTVSVDVHLTVKTHRVGMKGT